jgi:O-antigen ligase
VLFTGGIIESFTSFAGKDVTFSGRTDLWEAMMIEVSKHLYLGAGYQAFWSLDNPSALWLYEVFIWLPTQSHNGYIDILNELGLIGFIIFLFSLIKYFFSIKKLEESHPWKWLIIANLIINLQESTLFRPGHLVGEMVVISYFILYAQILEQEKIR